METGCVEGITQKLIRAEKHFAEVRSVLRSCNKGRCKLIPEKDEQLDVLVLRISIEPKGSPTLSAVVGDFLFTIRCVLDHLVYGIVQRAGITVSRQHMFPITDSLSAFRKEAKRRLNGVPADAQTVIERLQPYNTGNEALRWLDCLHNMDKHRTLNVTIAVSSDTHFVWGDTGFEMFLGNEELHDGAIMPVGVPLNVPAFSDVVNRLYEMKVEGECALFVAFKELSLDSSGDLEDFEVESVLHRIYNLVRHGALPDLEPFIDRPGNYS